MKTNKTLIIIDMQNDFISGSLANPAAEAIVEPICKYIEEFSGTIILTRDTHSDDYLFSPEGQKLPVEHCLAGTAGHCIDDRILKALRDSKKSYIVIDKPTFGNLSWPAEKCDVKDIEICGTCTDICVVSNALILKAIYPNAEITCLKNLCAGLTPEKHEAALEVMRSCQIEVK